MILETYSMRMSSPVMTIFCFSFFFSSLSFSPVFSLDFLGEVDLLGEVFFLGEPLALGLKAS